MSYPLENSIHFVMQSKGGIGKSVVSMLMSQYLLDNLGDVDLIDIDPNNKTLSSYKGLGVHQINIMKEDEELVDQSKFDGFLQNFLEKDSAIFLVDTGSGEFLPLNSYLTLMDIPNLIQEDFQKNIYIHVPISYGQAEDDSKRCLIKLADSYPTVPIIVWENEYFGKPTTEFAQTKAFQSIENIIGVVKIAKLNSDTFEKDFSTMIKCGMTFEEVRNDTKKFELLAKNRLNKIQKDIFAKLDSVFKE